MHGSVRFSTLAMHFEVQSNANTCFLLSFRTQSNRLINSKTREEILKSFHLCACKTEEIRADWPHSPSIKQSLKTSMKTVKEVSQRVSSFRTRRQRFRIRVEEEQGSKGNRRAAEEERLTTSLRRYGKEYAAAAANEPDYYVIRQNGRKRGGDLRVFSASEERKLFFVVEKMVNYLRVVLFLEHFAPYSVPDPVEQYGLFYGTNCSGTSFGTAQ